MSDKVIILGSGAAPGVPTISDGWGSCNPQNSKNERSRAGIYVELGHNRFLIDTSADLRNQLLYNNIRSVDAVFYTHVHADHVMGIDDLRSMNYGIKQLSSLHDIKAKLLDIFATDEHITEIRRRFSYVLADENSDEITHRPQLKPNAIAYNQPFNIGTTHIMPLKFTGHPVTTTGYVFNNGQLVIVPDYKVMPPETLAYLQQIEIKVMIMPLTKINNCLYHADMNINKQYIDAIRPQKTIFTHFLILVCLIAIVSP